MLYSKTKTVLLIASLIFSLSLIGFGQSKKGEGTQVQRLEVMLQKLETMRRSLKSALSVLEQESKSTTKKDFLL